MTDQERIDWLAKHHCPIGKDFPGRGPDIFGPNGGWFLKTKYPLHRQPRYETLREAIDAAMAEENQQ